MNKNENNPIAYAACSLNETTRMASSCGGIFSVLAEYILALNGVVYGVTMSENCRKAEFVRINCVDDLSKLRGSKYLQAQVGDTFNSVKVDLDNHVHVLFTGTGCQVNGLKMYLGKDGLDGEPTGAREYSRRIFHAVFTRSGRNVLRCKGRKA